MILTMSKYETAHVEALYQAGPGHGVEQAIPTQQDRWNGTPVGHGIARVVAYILITVGGRTVKGEQLASESRRGA